MTAFQIRPSHDGDGDSMLRVWSDAVDATHGFLSPQDRRDIEEQVAPYVHQSGFLVAVDAGDEPIGFLGGTGSNIDSLFVAPANHGRGVGTRLIEAFASQCTGALTVDVNEQNRSGRIFYERRGFRMVGRSDLDSEGRPYPLLHLRRPD